jgi:hypothetical protein
MRAAVQSQRVGDIESPSPKRGCAKRFQKSQPAGAATPLPSSASTGPQKIWMQHTPARKTQFVESLFFFFLGRGDSACVVRTLEVTGRLWYPTLVSHSVSEVLRASGISLGESSFGLGQLRHREDLTVRRSGRQGQSAAPSSAESAVS